MRNIKKILGEIILRHYRTVKDLMTFLIAVIFCLACIGIVLFLSGHFEDAFKCAFVMVVAYVVLRIIDMLKDYARKQE